MPTENRVRTYTVAELERLATDYLARHFGPDVLIPVDVDMLVEKRLRASRWTSGPSFRPTTRSWAWFCGTWVRVNSLYLH